MSRKQDHGKGKGLKKDELLNQGYTEEELQAYYDPNPEYLLTPSAQVSYEYDAVGNRIKMTDDAGTTLNTYDAAGELLTAGSIKYSYDANGNMVTKTMPLETSPICPTIWAMRSSSIGMMRLGVSIQALRPLITRKAIPANL